MRKLRVLVIIGLMACWVPVPSHAQVSIQLGGGETWYQGHPGRWYQENNQWRWRDADDGNEYYQDQGQYRWRNPYRFRNQIAGDETWYQGHPGRWYQENNQWRWRNADDNNEYYRDQDRYRWRSPYLPYNQRNPVTDRESYNQYQQTHPGAH